MPTRPKPAALIEQEGKSHRTKAELESRKIEEEKLLSGTRMKESAAVKRNKRAHQAFKRVQRIMQAIEKDDALYEAVLNRYCLILAEVDEYGAQRRRLEDRAEELDDLFRKREIEEKEHFDEMGKVLTMQIELDAMLQKKRKMLLDIEKENVMTVSAALRSIPKKPEDETANDPMAQMLAARMRREP